MIGVALAADFWGIFGNFAAGKFRKFIILLKQWVKFFGIFGAEIPKIQKEPISRLENSPIPAKTPHLRAVFGSKGVTVTP